MLTSGNESPTPPVDVDANRSTREALIEMSNRLEAALQAAVRDALIMHKRAGNPIAVWENEQVVWIAPEDIVIPEDPGP